MTPSQYTLCTWFFLLAREIATFLPIVFLPEITRLCSFPLVLIIIVIEDDQMAGGEQAECVGVVQSGEQNALVTP